MTTNYRDEAAALYASARAAVATAGYDDPAEVAIVGILGALLALDDEDDGSAPMSAEEVEAATQRIKAAVEGTRSGPPAAESDPLEVDDADTLEQPAYGARCTYRELGAGQCLDHAGHRGGHQPAAAPLSVSEG